MPGLKQQVQEVLAGGKGGALNLQQALQAALQQEVRRGRGVGRRAGQQGGVQWACGGGGQAAACANSLSALPQPTSHLPDVLLP